MTHSSEESAFPRWRRTLVALLVVVSCLCAPLSVGAIWVRNLVLNTDRYVSTVAPLATHPAIVKAIATDVSNGLVNALDSSTVADALPKGASFLAGPLSSTLQGFAQQATLKFLQSKQFIKFWNEANRLAHDQVKFALLGGGPILNTTNGKISISLQQVASLVIERLHKSGVQIFDKIPITHLAFQLELFDAKQLNSARTAVKIIDQVRLILPIVVLGLLAVAVWLSPNRRRTVIRWSIGMTIAMAVFGILLALGRTFYLNSSPGPSLPRDAAAAGWDILVRYLKLGIRIVALVTALVAVVAYVSGPYPRVVRLRSETKATIDRVRGKSVPEGWDFGTVGRWVGGHRPLLRWVGPGLGAAFLLLSNHPSPSGFVVVVVVVLIYLAIIEFLARAAMPAGTAAVSGGEGVLTGGKTGT